MLHRNLRTLRHTKCGSPNFSHALDDFPLVYDSRKRSDSLRYARWVWDKVCDPTS